jgi:hypothetical protein
MAPMSAQRLIFTLPGSACCLGLATDEGLLVDTGFSPRRAPFFLELQRIPYFLARLTWLNEGFCDFTLLRIRHDDPFGNPRWLQSRHEPAFFQLNRARTRLKSAVQPAEQPNQKNNRQWNAEKPK